MGTPKNTPSTARAARIEELRRAEAARARRVRLLTVGAAVVVAAGLVAGGVALAHSGPDARSTASDTKDGAAAKNAAANSAGDSGHFTTGKDGVRVWSGTLSRNHVSTPVDYPMHPPVGGNHNPVWLDCNGDVYTAPVKDENAVHALEHGAVWVTYTGKAAKADVAALAAKVKRTPYTLMSPYADQAAPLMLTAWGHQLAVKSASDPAVDTFLATYVQGAQTPEPGASCTGGTMK
ncbi:DUF3105 domain-containing protein [Streptomyces mangrovisoli]|uniref:DUF3105 domain-containing protein n=1 Tax=Streptomyces mangrovisoli TaxID=1428628 RepID=A0A1J4P108_9ACTN|nr:DUF3105 domain-containing protein [Streptomyces mangrovisoli]OIJ67165.1 hypothetical protein WN71_014225 [Streptomyces mangrovisoli]